MIRISQNIATWWRSRDRRGRERLNLCRKCRKARFWLWPLLEFVVSLQRTRLYKWFRWHPRTSWIVKRISPWPNVDILTLGPFVETIDETACAFCRIARHAVEYHDSHATQIAAVRWSDRGLEFVRRERLTDKHGRKEFMYNNRCRLQTARSSEDIVVMPYTENQAVEFAQARLSDCVGVHQSHCGSQEASTLSCSHIINVSDRRLLKVSEMPDDERTKPYFALSYVNGGVEIPKLLVENEHVLCARGGLDSLDLPAAFEDAIRFTLQCQMQYLWIDLLCIRQNDTDGLQTQIDMMDSIYGNACLVMIALLASSPKFGLFPRPFIKCVVDGFHYRSLSYPDLKYITSGRTTYHSRAWTYQEHFLARRTLVFGASYLVFRCDRSTWVAVKTNDVLISSEYENVQMTIENSITKLQNSITGSLNLQFQISLEEICRLISQFVSRRLTYQGDIERAFVGVAAVITKATGRPVIHGLPIALMPVCLFFGPQMSSPDKTRDHQPAHPCFDTDEQITQFPSWSWTSKGIPCEFDHFLFFGSFLGWFDYFEPKVVHFVLETANEFEPIDITKRNQRCSPPWHKNLALSFPPSPTHRRRLRSPLGPDILHFNAETVLASHYTTEENNVRTELLFNKRVVGVLNKMSENVWPPTNRLATGDSSPSYIVPLVSIPRSSIGVLQNSWRPHPNYNEIVHLSLVIRTCGMTARIVGSVFLLDEAFVQARPAMMSVALE